MELSTYPGKNNLAPENEGLKEKYIFEPHVGLNLQIQETEAVQKRLELFCPSYFCRLLNVLKVYVEPKSADRQFVA